MDRTALNALAADMVERGARDREPVYRELREQRLSPVQAIQVASRVLGLSLSEAKAAIYESLAWRDQHANWQQAQSALIHGAKDNDLPHPDASTHE